MLSHWHRSCTAVHLLSAVICTVLSKPKRGLIAPEFGHLMTVWDLLNARYFVPREIIGLLTARTAIHKIYYCAQPKNLAMLILQKTSHVHINPLD